MIVTPIHTEIVRNKSIDLFVFLDRYVPKLQEHSILVVTSKVLSLCEGSVRSKKEYTKEQLVQEEAEFYLPAQENKYGISLAIKHNMLIPSAGIDESNADGNYVLWPKNPQKIANQIREHFKNIGVIITDSKTTPLRWGTTGVSLAHSGFYALNDYIGTSDIFGRTLEVTKANIADALAAAAVVVMGEGNEQIPLAVISDIPFVKFQNRNPSIIELEALKISLDEDVYGSILTRAPWKHGVK